MDPKRIAAADAAAPVSRVIVEALIWPGAGAPERLARFNITHDKVA